jgi:hypothetical protein
MGKARREGTDGCRFIGREGVCWQQKARKSEDMYLTPSCDVADNRTVQVAGAAAVAVAARVQQQQQQQQQRR